MRISRLGMLTLAVVCLSAAPRISSAQKTKPQPKPSSARTFEDHAKNVSAAEAKKVVKSDQDLNKPGAKAPVPAKKAGHGLKATAHIGELHVDNRTDYYIRIYVDGDFVGTVSPYGDSYGTLGDCSGHTLTGIAYFTDGSTKQWGPHETSATCGDYTWRLWD